MLEVDSVSCQNKLQNDSNFNGSHDSSTGQSNALPTKIKFIKVISSSKYLPEDFFARSHSQSPKRVQSIGWKQRTQSTLKFGNRQQVRSPTRQDKQRQKVQKMLNSFKRQEKSFSRQKKDSQPKIATIKETLQKRLIAKRQQPTKFNRFINSNMIQSHNIEGSIKETQKQTSRYGLKEEDVKANLYIQMLKNNMKQKQSTNQNCIENASFEENNRQSSKRKYQQASLVQQNSFEKQNVNSFQQMIITKKKQSPRRKSSVLQINNNQIQQCPQAITALYKQLNTNHHLTRQNTKQKLAFKESQIIKNKVTSQKRILSHQKTYRNKKDEVQNNKRSLTADKHNRKEDMPTKSKKPSPQKNNKEKQLQFFDPNGIFTFYGNSEFAQINFKKNELEKKQDNIVLPKIK